VTVSGSALNARSPSILSAMPEIADLDPAAAPAAEREGEFVTFPGSPFQLFKPYEPAGDQPQAIEGLVEGIRDGLIFQNLMGVTGSGKTFTMANVIAQIGRP